MESAFRHAAHGVLAGVAEGGHSGEKVAAIVGHVVGVVRLPDAHRAGPHRWTSACDAGILERDYAGCAAGARVDDLGGAQSASAITSSQFRSTESTLSSSMVRSRPI